MGEKEKSISDAVSTSADEKNENISLRTVIILLSIAVGVMLCSLFIINIARDSASKKVYVEFDSQISTESIVPDVDLVNINTASYQELLELPGIGDKRAQAIIDERQILGGFESIEELKNIDGISEKVFESIRNLICVK